MAETSLPRPRPRRHVGIRVAAGVLAAAGFATDTGGARTATGNAIGQATQAVEQAAHTAVDTTARAVSGAGTDLHDFLLPNIHSKEFGTLVDMDEKGEAAKGKKVIGLTVNAHPENPKYTVEFQRSPSSIGVRKEDLEEVTANEITTLYGVRVFGDKYKGPNGDVTLTVKDENDKELKYSGGVWYALTDETGDFVTPKGAKLDITKDQPYFVTGNDAIVDRDTATLHDLQEAVFQTPLDKDHSLLQSFSQYMRDRGYQVQIFLPQLYKGEPIIKNVAAYELGTYSIPWDELIDTKDRKIKVSPANSPVKYKYQVGLLFKDKDGTMKLAKLMAAHKNKNGKWNYTPEITHGERTLR